MASHCGMPVHALQFLIQFHKHSHKRHKHSCMSAFSFLAVRGVSVQKLWRNADYSSHNSTWLACRKVGSTKSWERMPGNHYQKNRLSGTNNEVDNI